VDLDAVAKAVVEEQRVLAEERGSGLVFEGGLGSRLRGNDASLRAMIANLIDNAIRYASPGEIVVRTRRDSDAAIVEVQDSGPGIPADERERVFDRFYRREGAEVGGSGLGLAIVRRIAERHGGSVELLDSPRGEGLLARVSIPLAP